MSAERAADDTPPAEPRPRSSLIASVATVGSYTMISRVLGFLRDMMMAALLGAGPIADAFLVAFKLPNFLRRLFAEGAFNAGFVPLFARTLEGEGKAVARDFAGQAQAVLLAVLIPLVIVAIIFMPWIIRVMTPGFEVGSERYEAAGRSFPHHLLLHPVHLAGRPLWRHLELARPFRCARGSTHHPEPLPDRRHGAQLCLVRRDRQSACLEPRDRRPRPMCLGVRCNPPGGHGASVSPPAPEPEGEAPVCPHSAGRVRCRRRADQPVRRYHLRVLPGRRCRILSLLRRSRRAAAPGRDRRCRRHRLAAAHVTAVARRRNHGCDPKPEPRHRARASPDHPGSTGHRRAQPADRDRAV